MRVRYTSVKTQAHWLGIGRRALDVLHRIEWGVTGCPDCGRSKVKGHRKDCQLAAVLLEATDDP